MDYTSLQSTLNTFFSLVRVEARPWGEVVPLVNPNCALESVSAPAAQLRDLEKERAGRLDTKIHRVHKISVRHQVFTFERRRL